MEHLNTEISFVDKSQNIWKVSYVEEICGEYNFKELVARVYLNGELYYFFDEIPYTKTSNPTKTKSKEIIALAKKNKLEL